MNAIPRYDLSSDFATIWPEISRDLETLVRRGELILGEAVERFEEAFSHYQRVRYTVGVGSGTDALELALRAAGIGAGDEVIVPANTFYASAAAVLRIGAVPVVVDCDPEYLLIDPEAVRAAVGPHTAGIMPVHLYGQMADMHAIGSIASAAGLAVVEDAAQSHGASQNGTPAGGSGLAAGTSFHPHKNLAAWGDAGAVLTGDPTIARKVRRLRQYGADERRIHADVGWNSRLDAVQATVLSARLLRLAAGDEARRTVARRYTSALATVDGVATPRVAPGNSPAWHLYVVTVDDRDRVLADMRASGIGVSADYATPIHLHPGLAGLGYREGAFPVAEAAARRILSLPIYPSLTGSQVERVVDVLVESVRRAS